MATCHEANFIKALNRNHVLVRRDLEDRIGGGVENRMSRAHMLRAKAVEDFRAACGNISDEPDVSRFFDGLHHFPGKTIVCPERFLEHNTRKFPVSRRGILAGGQFGEDAGASGFGRRRSGAAGERESCLQADFAEMGKF